MTARLLAHPRRGDAEGGSGRRRRDGGDPRARFQTPSPTIALQAARELYLTGAICEAANDNGGGQVVISGTKAAVERAMELAKLERRQARAAAAGVRAVPLHADEAGRRRDGRGAEAGVQLDAPKPPLVANFSATALTDPDAIRREPRRSGDGHGALARERRLDGERGRDALRRDRRGQDARRPRQAHRRRRDGD